MKNSYSILFHEDGTIRCFSLNCNNQVEFEILADTKLVPSCHVHLQQCGLNGYPYWKIVYYLPRGSCCICMDNEWDGSCPVHGAESNPMGFVGNINLYWNSSEEESYERTSRYYYEKTKFLRCMEP